MFPILNRRVLSVGTLAGCLALCTASAEDVQFDNGHYYRLVLVPARSLDSGIRWEQAQAAAAAAGGYLATCTSAAENDFVFSLTAVPEAWITLAAGHWGPWLGGEQVDQTLGPADGWAWSNGEPWSFSAWAPGQPDDAGGQPQNRLLYFYSDGQGSSATWDDVLGVGPEGREVYLKSFLVEFDSPPVVSPWMKSTFESGIEGWAVCGDATQLRWQEPASNRRSHIFLTDQQDGGTAGFLAPAQFLGRKSATYGGRISFDLRTTEGVNLHPAADIQLHGAGRSIFLDLPDPKVDVWTPRIAPLTATAGWRVGGPQGEPATKADLLAVLGDLQAIWINGEFHHGSDKTMIDDFVLSIRADLDHDADVDTYDLALFQECLSGPAVLHKGTEICQTADEDEDGDVDQSDFGGFQRCWSGPNVPADPDCAK